MRYKEFKELNEGGFWADLTGIESFDWTDGYAAFKDFENQSEFASDIVWDELDNIDDPEYESWQTRFGNKLLIITAHTKWNSRDGEHPLTWFIMDIIENKEFGPSGQALGRDSPHNIREIVTGNAADVGEAFDHWYRNA